MDVINLQIHKLGHNLDEIRTRALNNILNKLDMKLVSEEELIENPEFIKNVIKWFTFPFIPKKDVVLKLILRLSKIDRGRALIIRYDPNLKIIQQATIGESKELFEELLLNCRSLVSSISPEKKSSSSLELSVTSRRDVGNVWIIWRSLPYVELVDSDSKLISSLHSSLLSTDLFNHSAQYFSSIVIRDFPPQVFLQQPQIVNVFIDVIQSKRPEGAVAAGCLREFTQSLINQINICKNVHTTPLFLNKERVGTMELSVSSGESTCNSSRSIESGSSSLEICKKERTVRKTESRDLMDYCVSVVESLVRSESYREVELLRSALGLMKLITSDPNIPWHMTPVHKFSYIFDTLAASSHRSQVLEALDKLELDIVLWELLDNLVPSEVADIALNKQMQDALYLGTIDPVITHLYPKIHKSFSSYLDRCKYSPSATYKILVRVGNSIKTGAEFLYSHDGLIMKEVVDLFSLALEGIEYHQNYSIIPAFLQICVQRFNEVVDCLDECVSSSVLQLLSSSDLCIVKATLSELYHLTESVLVPSQLTKNTVINIRPLLHIVINHKILIEIISYCLSSQNKELAVLSEDILILILKSKRLLNSENWNIILVELIPTFPYLQVFGCRTTPLGKEILNIFDPDNAVKYDLPKLQVLLGNIRFLVSKDSGARDEAISRLMYLLDIPTKPLNLILPHDPIIPKKNLTDIYEPSSMVRVIDLLHEPGLDTRVIKSALVQLSVMTEDILLHDLFIKHSGLDIIISFLNSPDKEFYKEIFCPSLTILKNFVQNNGKLRFEISNNYDILKNSAKGLFTYDLDWRMQRDISQFLVLVSFSGVIHNSADSVSFPYVILEKIRDPFPPASHAQTSQYSLPSYRDDLLKESRHRCLLSLQWSLGCHQGNLDALLKSVQMTDSKQYLCSIAPSDVSNVSGTDVSHPALLPLAKSALMDLCLCHPYRNIAGALDKLATATSFKIAFSALKNLKRYSLFLAVSEPVDLSSLPWEEAFTRYLATPPSGVADQQLLLDIVKFFRIKSCDFKCHANWLSKLFQNHYSVLVYLMKETTTKECTSLKKELCMEKLMLLKKCMKFCKEGWNHVFTLLVQALNIRHSLGLYSQDLGVLGRLVECIFEGNKMGYSCSDMVPALYQLLPILKPTCPTSYMGVGITKLSLASLNNCLDSKKNQESIIDWDLHCIVDRLACLDSITKAFVLQLLSKMCFSSSSTSQVINSSKDLWSSCLSYLLNMNEVNIVREQAARLCANVLFHLERKDYVEDAVRRDLFRSLSIVCSKLSCDKILPAKTVAMLQSSTQFLHSSGSVTSVGEEDSKSDDNIGLVMSTISLLEAACCLVINMIEISNDSVESLRTQGLSSALFRYLCNWLPQSCVTDETKVSLYTKVMKLLSRCPSHSGKLANDSLCNVVWILQPSSIKLKIPNKSLLDKLWMEGINLLNALLTAYPDGRVHLTNECMKTLENSISSNNQDLQSSCLSCVPALAPSLNSNSSQIFVEKLIAIWNKTNTKVLVRQKASFALASLLANSHAGTQAALAQGFTESLVSKLRETYVSLNILPPEIPRQKKCNAVLNGLSLDVKLLTNLLAANKEAKERASSLGVADTLHKLWNWCLLDFSLILSLLQTLITLTASSIQGSLSLVLTSTVVGVGQRKSPTSFSLLHAVLELLSMPVYSVEIKKNVLQLACHACQAQECRVVLSKSHILKDFLKFYETKNNAGADLELNYLNFFCVFTYYPEGAFVLKDQEFFDYLINCVSGNRRDHLRLSLIIFRNVSFQSQGKQKILMSDNLLSVLCSKLLDESLSVEEERKDIILIVWALSANSQKSKQVLRNYGFHERIQLLSALIPEYTLLSTTVETALSVLES